MPVTLRPMPSERMPQWIRRSSDEYAGDLIAVGRSAAEAKRVAEDGMTESFPAGQPTAGHAVFEVFDGGDAVGYLWIGPSTGSDDGAWWVWDIVIDEVARGRGLGRSTMLHAEDYAASHGAHTLGLSVFVFNTGARRLYESLGFETTAVEPSSVKMSKALRHASPPAAEPHPSPHTGGLPAA